MKNNKSINELEFEFLNGKQKPKSGWKLYLYNIAKYFLYVVYIMIEFVCTFTEILIYILSFGIITISWIRNGKK